MSRFERLLLPIIALVMIGAFLLESVDATGVRTIAITLGVIMVVAIVFGMYHRARKKLRAAQSARLSDHTSNDVPGG